jgi:alpha-L-fucosidase
MGNWLKKYGESVYETTGGPYKPNDWLTSTRKGNDIYIHLMNYENQSVELPFPENIQIKNCSLLKGKKLDFKQTGQTLKIELPQKEKEMISVLKITIDSDSGELKTMEL